MLGDDGCLALIKNSWPKLTKLNISMHCIRQVAMESDKRDANISPRKFGII